MGGMSDNYQVYVSLKEQAAKDRAAAEEGEYELHGVVARVGDDGDEPGLVDDCDASNDEATWVDPCG